MKSFRLKSAAGMALLGTAVLGLLLSLCVARESTAVGEADPSRWLLPLMWIALCGGLLVWGLRQKRDLTRQGRLLTETQRRVEELESSLQSSRSERLDSGIEQGRTETARRAAEGLRPPVGALSLILERMPHLNADSVEAAQGALTKIRAVTADLLRAAGDPDLMLTAEETKAAEPLLAIVERVLRRKRQEMRGRPKVRIETGTLPGFPGPFAKVDPLVLERVLSDLIDNSVDALIATEGTVRLDLLELPHKQLVELRVSDDGVGVPREVIASLGIKRVSAGRHPGEGLFHAYHRTKDWGGQLGLSRRPDRGTVCSIRLPLATVASWMTPVIRLPSGGTILVLEKDPEAMNLWTNYASLASLGLTFRLAHRGVDFDACVREKERPDLCFVSQELGDELINGLDLIDANHVAARSVLMTGTFENRALRKRAERLGVKVLPKELVEAALGPGVRHLLRSSADPGLKLGLMTRPSTDLGEARG